MEIALASKCKLAFVTGGVKRDPSDKVKQDCWDTCNSMVISWILSSVFESIRKSVMFTNDAAEIWNHLQRRFSVTNGAKKYKMKALWVELEPSNMVPPITNLTPEVNAFIKALNDQKEELKLFQFLSGLDDDCGAQRSQILMLSKLSTVKEACNMIQQQETQREVFKHVKEEPKGMAMNTKKGDQMCGNCGKLGHITERCWTVVGYPNKNSKRFRENKFKGRERNKAAGGRDFSKGNQSLSKGKGRMAANVSGQTALNSGITAKKLEQLLKLLPTPSGGGDEDSTEEEGSLRQQD
ncbi:putative polyketide biosynthesis enoyl-CoA hydratase PksH [Bienertia sinuspersici]